MEWWAWILLGVLLLTAELGLVDTGFYLVFLGASALIVGLIEICGLELPLWGQWLAYAVLSVSTMVAFRQRVYLLLRGGLPGVGESLIGELVVLADDVAPGASCRVELRGTTWTARNEGSGAIEAGSRARVARVEGLVLGISAPEAGHDGPPTS